LRLIDSATKTKPVRAAPTPAGVANGFAKVPLALPIWGSVRSYGPTLPGLTNGRRAAQLATGGYAGGRPPFGWRAEGKELVLDEREQEVIGLARQLSDQGAQQPSDRSSSGSGRPAVFGAGRPHPAGAQGGNAGYRLQIGGSRFESH